MSRGMGVSILELFVLDKQLGQHYEACRWRRGAGGEDKKKEKKGKKKEIKKGI